MRIAGYLAGLAAVAMVVGCRSGSSDPAVAGPTSAHLLPSGWRWESYGGVEVGVPTSWGYGTTDTPWCLNSVSKQAERPYVGRPGSVPDVGCVQPTGGGPDPASQVKTGGTFVWFGGAGGDKAVGDQETRKIGGVAVEVQAPAPLRRQILATAHSVTTDANGCPSTHPIDGHPQWRPKVTVPVSRLTGVSSVSACRYGKGLTSSLRLEGEPAVRAIAAVAAAPLGGGPNDPADCAPEEAHGDEAIVLLVHSEQGQSTIALRYSGCIEHGLDDGSTVRTLTHAAVAPFVTGPNQVSEYQGNLDSIFG